MRRKLLNLGAVGVTRTLDLLITNLRDYPMRSEGYVASRS